VRTIPFIVFIPILSAGDGLQREDGDRRRDDALVLPELRLVVSSGLNGLPLAASDLARVFGASRWRKLVLIALPAALPKLFTSIRLSASRGSLGRDGR
jgi:NitT/TauT family transport system permease protein